MVFYHRHLGFFALSSISPDLSAVNLIKVAIWWWNQGFYFRFHTKAGFSTFYIELRFTPTASMGWIFYLALSLAMIRKIRTWDKEMAYNCALFLSVLDKYPCPGMLTSLVIRFLKVLFSATQFNMVCSHCLLIFKLALNLGELGLMFCVGSILTMQVWGPRG